MADEVTVTFKYTPNDPDPEDRTGLSEDEHQQLMDQLMQLGAEDIEISKV